MNKENTTIWKCECGKNIIILDESLKSTKLERNDILCPLCGNEIVSECVKNISIGSIRDDKKTMTRLKEIKEKLKHIPIENEETMQYYVFYKEDIKFLLERFFE